MHCQHVLVHNLLNICKRKLKLDLMRVTRSVWMPLVMKNGLRKNWRIPRRQYYQYSKLWSIFANLWALFLPKFCKYGQNDLKLFKIMVPKKLQRRWKNHEDDWRSLGPVALFQRASCSSKFRKVLIICKFWAFFTA